MKLKLITFKGIQMLVQDFSLNPEEEIELLRIRNYMPPVEMKQDYADSTGRHWEVDEDFSRLCVEGSGWK